MISACTNALLFAVFALDICFDVKPVAVEPWHNIPDNCTPVYVSGYMRSISADVWSVNCLRQQQRYPALVNK